ncbi:hypothetical protein R1flu_016490 [Riccia fluitans]|uniref:Uncharacterized protein n=1 Tax=Riccia fluitans TaxID=41844 RepID=A0ABD1YLZ8_9MARC
METRMRRQGTTKPRAVASKQRRLLHAEPTEHREQTRGLAYNVNPIIPSSLLHHRKAFLPTQIARRLAMQEGTTIVHKDFPCMRWIAVVMCMESLL